jgi:subtilisin family serine protease
VAALAALGVVSGAGAASKSVPGGELENATPAGQLLGVGNRAITVVVQLQGDPITLADASSQANGSGSLSSDQKKQVREQLKAQQAPVVQQIQAKGGTVLATYQAAYNGIKVQISARKAGTLSSISGVVGVHTLPTYTPSNVHGIPFIGAPAAWDGVNGVHGEGMKIADIDTGIDYTHADFGGSGNPLDFQNAAAASTLPANPAWFGASAPKVKGGIDLVGDDYNANPSSAGYQPVPHADPNPLDCNGHGTHTAGTAAGFGVLSDGSTYTGPYNASTVAGHSWDVGPGVAPKADIYSVRVFGCAGSTNVVVDAIEWAVDHNMDAINMSLGAPFGGPDNPDAVAASNAAKDGVIVVSASGNDGSNPYVTSSPGSGTNGIAVAANDPTESFPGANVALSTGTTVQAIDANGADLSGLTNLPVKVLKNGDGTISLGCNPAEYTAAGVTGDVVVVKRGTCARVARAIYGQKAGAAAVIMVNTSNAFPPFEGKITSNPDTGESYTVTIPFLGVKSSSAAALVAADAAGGTATVTAMNIANPGFRALASFSSYGPRPGDSALKPDVTAPGVSIASAGMGTGTGAVIESGTSMATPHTTGLAALVKQAHPDWKKVDYWKAAIVNTANPGGVADYSTRGAGAGLIQAFQATHTQVVALGDPGTASLSYGVASFDRDYSQRDHVTLRNLGDAAATFNVSDALDQGSPHSVVLGTTQVTVPAHGSKDVQVELHVPVATAGDAWAGQSYPFNSVAGLITFTPASGSDNGNISLRVPYFLVPEAISHVQVHGVDSGLLKQGTATATITNTNGAVAGPADWFAWGLKSRSQAKLSSDDLLAEGVQSYPTAPAPSNPATRTGWLQFAISTVKPWSTPSENEFDTYVDVNGDDVADYLVVAVDGSLLSSSFSLGTPVVGVAPLAADGSLAGGFSIRYLSAADFNGTTMEIPVDFGQLCRATFACISATKPIVYSAAAFSETDGTFDAFDSEASYNLFHPVFTANYAAFTGDEDVVAPNATATDAITVDKAQWAATPQLGLLVVSQNNLSKNDKDEAQTLPLNLK